MASTTKSTVIAAFRNSADAQAAAQDLQAAGINRGDIYLESSSSGTSTGSGSTTSGYGSRTAASEGGITGWFKSLFGAENDTDRVGYEQAYSQGGYLLSVDAQDNQIDQVEAILNRHSPVNVHTDDAYAGGSTGTTAAALGTAGTAGLAGRNVATNASESIPVVEEELQVGKRRVQRGGVRVYSRVIEQPVEESIELQEEHVRVDRRPVNRPATAADFTSGREQVLEVEEFAEQAVVSKQARVVEEVRVGKETSQRSETVRDTVRHTEVEVEQLANTATTGASTATGTAFDDSDFRRDFQTNYGTSGASYDTYSPAYRYGYDMASDPRYKGKSFSAVESQLRSDYGSRYPGSTWDKMKNSIQYGWNKVTGKA